MTADEVYKLALETTLSFEGGFSDNANDPGGATMRGVTQKRYDEYRRSKFYNPHEKADVRAITDLELAEIYRTYWDAVEGDALVSGGQYGLALMLFDIAVNSGPARAREWLTAEIVPMIESLFARRMSHYANLQTWNTFGKGWAYRATKVYEKAKELEAMV